MRILSIIALTFAFSSCSTTRLSDVFPETACGDHGQLVIEDHNTTFAPIVGGKSSAVGYGEVVGVQVYNGKGVRKARCSGSAPSCFTAGSAFALGGTTVLNPYTSSAHYGLGGNVGLPGFATLPYTAGNYYGSYNRTPIVLNSASGYGMSCGPHGACGKSGCAKSTCGSKQRIFTTRKAVKQTEQNYEIQK